MCWIKVIGEPAEGECTCWQGLILPPVEFCTGDRVINAFNRELWDGKEVGYIVSTLRAMLVLAKKRHLQRGLCARRCIPDEEYPYMFFPASRCCILTADESPKFVTEIS